MTSRPPVRTCVALLVALLAAPIARAEPPTIYKWVDENGIAHYTTDRGRIPSEIRARIERPAPAVSTPTPVAAPTPAYHEDEMRDAVRVKPSGAIAPAPAPAIPAPATAAAPPAAAPPPPEPAAAAVATPASQPVTRIEEIPPPLATEAPPSQASRDGDAVSSPPPAPLAPLTPTQNAEIAKLDSQIQSIESQISEREENLAMLLSRPEDERAAPLIDDPKFREISQHLPKLQAELQTLRERRNKIQPPATP